MTYLQSTRRHVWLASSLSMMRTRLASPSWSRSLVMLRMISSNTTGSASPLATEISPSRNSDKPKIKITVDRELPDVRSRTPRLIVYYSIFFSIMGAISLVFFNYERQQSPVVSSTLYSIRRSPTARAVLGANIRFRDPVPWISGSLDFLHGDVDVSYAVIGSKDVPAKLRFRSIRRGKGDAFEVVEWSLTTEHGQVINLIADANKELISFEEGDALLGK
ncbi:cytochrome oxidase complex assembly protein 1-domain-containing protein [Lipomyces japonicus]|uniref:cytochrome oxidase complex assembly protein 1-domain-containing protein n=1 Tax=Lipomyces japonicus TaxID=56871 RepID=UPI0034CF39C9